MLLTVDDIIEQAQEALQDTQGTRWTVAQLRRTALRGQVWIVDKAPWLSTTVQSITVALELGIEQAITEHGGRAVSRVLDVPWNQTGATIGAAIRKIAKDQMDAQRPTWPRDTASPTIQHWIPSDTEQTAFMVYPPAAAGASVRARIALVPSSATAMELVDSAQTALLLFILWWCYSRDVAYAKEAKEYRALLDTEMKQIMGATVSAAQTLQQRQPPR